MFVDSAKIYIKAGDGGDQIIAETQINESVRRILVMKHTAIEKE